jgi:trehalose 6-phosphate synthase/phosphatase
LKSRNNHIEKVVAEYARAKNRILLLDYDGTLAPFTVNPQDAQPSDVVLKLLSQLANNAANHVVIISGREKTMLDDWLGKMPLTLVAEHGGFYKEWGQPWKSFFSNVTSWKMKVLPFLQALTVQHEGSSIEEKHFSIAWHYRAVANKIHKNNKEKIFSTVQSLLEGNVFSVYDEDCTLEFRTTGIDKGTFVDLYKKGKPPADFVLAIGDGKTDEDLFRVLGKDGYGVKVGSRLNSAADFFLEKQENVVSFLTQFIDEKY